MSWCLRRHGVLVVLVAGLMVALSSGVAQAAIVKLSVGQMGRLAHTIVVGRVVSSSCRWVTPAPGESGRGSIATVTRLRLVDAIKGKPEPVVTVTTPGGTVGSITQVVDDVPVFRPGQRCILFLDSRGRVIAAREGKLDVIDGAVPALGGALLRAAERRIARAAGVSVPLLRGGKGGVGSPSPASAATAPVGLGASPADIAPVPGLTSDRSNASVTVLSDGFEGTMANWSLVGTPAWGITTYRAASGSHSAYCVQGGTAAPGPYGNNVGNWMIAGPFDLSDANTAGLDFDTWFSMGTGDGVYFGISTNGSSFSLGGWTAQSSGGWYHMHQDLGNWFGTSYLGQPQVWLAYRFASDASTTAEGAYVDNVVLAETTGAAPTITTISPASASAGTSTPVTITGTGFGAAQGTGSVDFYYNGSKTIPGTVTSWSDTQIQCTVPTATIDGYPASAGTGPVTVTDGTGVTGPAYNGFSVTFGYGGVKWAAPGMAFRVNPNCADTADEVALVDAGALLWNPPSNFLFTDGGATTATAYSYNGHNEIFWVPAGTLPNGVLAQASYWFSDGTVTETDIEFNDYYIWGDGSSGGVYDIQSIASHELGHTLNLRDLYGPGDSAKIMYGFGGSGQQKHALDQGDRGGIVWIYGARPPISGTMKVNSDAAYTRTMPVTLNSSVVNATQMRFSNDNATWSGWEAYAATKGGWALTGGDGIKTVYAQYQDAGGNVYSQTDTILLDTTAPVTTDNSGGLWHATPFTLTLSPTDAGSGMSGGVAKTEYSTDGGTTWQTGTSLAYTANWKRGGGSGSYAVQYRSTDAAGNSESAGPVTVQIDTSRPWTSNDAPIGPQSTAVTVHLTGHDAFSGIAQVWYSVDGADWTQGTSPVIAAPPGHSNDGLHTISYYSVDNAGNYEVGFKVCWVTILTP